MALTYNIEEDVFYQKGIEKGIENKTQAFVKKMLQKGTLKLQEIAEFAEVSLDFVKKIQEEIKKIK